MLLSWTNVSEAQLSGTIFMDNGENIAIKDFEELNVTLLYYWNMWSARPSNEPGEYFRDLNYGELKEISFIYQKDRGKSSFTCRLSIEASTVTEEHFRKKIKTWDWLVVKTPPDSRGKTTRINFFHDKKRYDIRKIVFDWETENSVNNLFYRIVKGEIPYRRNEKIRSSRKNLPGLPSSLYLP